MKGLAKRTTKISQIKLTKIIIMKELEKIKKFKTSLREILDMKTIEFT